MLFWREKVGVPAGILPRAFSDIPRSCRGTSSSACEATDDDREGCSLGLEGAGVGRSSSSLSSSSSPIANVESSSGTSRRADSLGWAVVGLLMLSTELRVEFGSNGSLSFLLWFRLSISSCPLSNVNERNASVRFRFLRTAYTNAGFSAFVSRSQELIRNREETYSCIGARRSSSWTPRAISGGHDSCRWPTETTETTWS